MKLKTLVSSLAIAGLMSTSAFAATHTAVAGHTTTNDMNAFWQSVSMRNQDNNGHMITGLQAGQSKVSGELAMSIYHADRRSGKFAGSTTLKQSTTRFALPAAEMFYDAQVNAMTSVHLGVDYVTSTTTDNTTTDNTTTVTLPEAYAHFSHGKFYVNAGRQYLNFGDTAHDTITTPVVEALSETSANALTVGAVNLHGFYANASLFNSAATYGNTSTNQQENNTNAITGMTAELGYAMNQGMNQFYGYNGLNLYVDYLSNLEDTNAVVAANAANNKTKYHDAVPGMAFHAGYATGAFQVSANYVMANKKFADADKLSFTGQDAKPSAYNLEGDYSWMTTHRQEVALTFGQTEQMLGMGINTNVAGYSFAMPKTTIGIGYNYYVSKNVELQGEYLSLADYSTSKNGGDSTSKTTLTKGTGDTANAFAAQIKVKF
jgi:hypothetical protein